MADGKGPARVALHEIERLIREAGLSGAPVDTWVEQVADELRSAMPELGPRAAADLARRILADPRGSLGAQAHLDGPRLRVLRD